jgi:hypothetical protein
MRYPAAKLVKMSDQWRKFVVQEQSHAAEIAYWPALLSEPVACDGMSVVSLTDKYQLELEGMRLDHCVSDHVWQCLQGDSHILSIRDASGRSLSTAEIVLEKDQFGGLIPTVNQHQGAKNSEPELSSKAALSAAMHRLMEQHQQLWFRKITAELAARKNEIESYLSLENCGSAIRVIADVLPRVDQAEAWLMQRLIEEELWCLHRNDLIEEAAAKAGLEDLYCRDTFELWLDDPYRWAQYERLTGRDEVF